MSLQGVRKSFRRLCEGPSKILVDPGFHDWLQEMGVDSLGTVIRDAQVDPSRGGRRACRLFCPDNQTKHRLVIRHYAHGGLLRRLLGDHLLRGSRPFRELAITEMARRGGVPTLQAVAAVNRRSWGPFFQGDLITWEIPGSKDLIAFLCDPSKISPEDRLILRQNLAREAGRVVRIMHDRGIYHGDLNLRNLLIQNVGDTDPKVYVIDFDRSRVCRSLSTAARLRNLLRLNRSAEKWKAKGVMIRSTDKARFFQAYAQGDRKMIQTMRRRLRRVRALGYWHRLGWRLDRLFNPHQT